MGEEVSVDFSLRPVIGRAGIVSVNRRFVPLDAGCRALVLVDAAEGMPELMGDNAGVLVVGGGSGQPAQVQSGLIGGNGQAVGADE